ncbi:N-6 DNA methylase [Oscillibacter hominis]|uniref:site-specific DNA-methyltransferase (adenine-specific) n=1 Tax=Oscillibacter hominis TaxID=2763056 RepID=A0A7G9B6F9_9FIRM|nr:class I SAM-dependent DNA methyltransferase [Oscillibacter hominis]QNL45140.1 N-6 DNA methylase [Oscillibacter hominis]
MAIKKNELYSSLWASCDKLRGGMDASQYKDYILTLLFVKYVTDKFKGVKYADITVPEGGSFDDLIALKGNKNIGEEMDKVIAKLAEAGENNLRGVIDNAHFNDEAKLGSGKEMVDKLTGLIAIFQRDEFNFKKNKTSGDDILGDAYEYLMRHFATESGKSKGQFYTPAEVSRILAKVIGIDKIEERDEGYSVYDPACGSGSLLIRAADEAPFEIAIWGQEKEVTTAGLAKMNLVLHNKAAGEIKAGNTFSSPHYFEDGSDDEVLKRFDFAVANPPFSLKNWMDGLKDYGRFDGYGDRPPEKNGDFAWLLHILKSLKSTGKAAVILPHGVLFRGNAEATIRKAIIDKGYIKGIIGLPANLFYGTSIPACILVIDKESADQRTGSSGEYQDLDAEALQSILLDESSAGKGIFMIDASHDFVKDGNKNRLRERDIYKIVTTFNQQVTDDPKYARFVPNWEIKVKNEYNLNIPRYIDSSTPEDLQDIDGHLHGGIPAADVDSMDKYWALFPSLKTKLFSQMRDGYYQLNIPKDDIRNTVYNNPEFSAYAERIDDAFDAWMQKVDGGLRSIDEDTELKPYIVELAQQLIDCFEGMELVDKYDVYEVLLSYWHEVMGDDMYLVSVDGYGAARQWENIMGEYTSGKKKGQEKVVGWEGVLLPKALIESVFFTAERKAINDAQAVAEETQSQLDEFVEEQTGDEGYLKEHLNDKDKVDAKAVAARLKVLKKADPKDEEYAALKRFADLTDSLAKQNKAIKEMNAELEEKVRKKYALLTDEEILDLLINRKWYAAIFEGIKALYVTTSHRMTNRIVELVERYEDTLPELTAAVTDYEAKVKAHLERMGFVW